MAKEESNEEVKQDGGGFDRNQFLNQIKSEQTKKRREALKATVSGLLAKRAEAEKTIALTDKEIDEALTKFEQGL